MKIIVAPDKFRGSLSATEASEVIASAISAFNRSIEVVKVPLSDGGDGFLEGFRDLPGTNLVKVSSFDASMNKIDSEYLILENDTAVIEMANTVGLARSHRNNPGLTSSYGMGVQIKDALDKGIRSFLIGIGGSATNDAGCGVLAALGADFFDLNGRRFLPTGGTLDRIWMIDWKSFDDEILKAKITVLSDVLNPLLGPDGASRIYAPQKGADPDMILLLEENMRHFSEFLKTNYGINPEFVGAGAAGGVNVALKGILGATIEVGIEGMLSRVSFERLLDDADLVITGEGKLDRQSIYGKVVAGLAKLCSRCHVPLITICGRIDGLNPEDYPFGLEAAYQIWQPDKDPRYSFDHAKELLYQKTLEALKLDRERRY